MKINNPFYVASVDPAYVALKTALQTWFQAHTDTQAVDSDAIRTALGKTPAQLPDGTIQQAVLDLGGKA